MHFEHFRCEMPGFCNATQCLHQVPKLTAGRYHLATAFTYQGTIEVRRTMSLIGTFETCRGRSDDVRCSGQTGSDRPPVSRTTEKFINCLESQCIFCPYVRN